MKKPNIKEVAAAAGVSVATVSYVVNGLDKVSKATVEKVLKIVREMNYRPALNVNTPSTGPTKLICVVLPLLKNEDHVGKTLRNNPYYSDFVSKVMTVLEKYGYEVIVSGAYNDLDLENRMVARKVDGYIIFGDRFEKFSKELYEKKIPTVLIDVNYDSPLPSVSVDEERSAYLQTSYLIDRKHRNIGFVVSDLETSTVSKRRLKGYKKALEDAGLPFEEDNILKCPATYKDGSMIADQIMEDRYDLTAVVCSSDIVALSIQSEFLTMGRRIPEDLSVVGCDNINACNYVFPRLTTVDQKYDDKAEIAAKTLVNMLKGVSCEGKTVLEPELIIRNSVKKRKK